MPPPNPISGMESLKLIANGTWSHAMAEARAVGPIHTVKSNASVRIVEALQTRADMQMSCTVSLFAFRMRSTEMERRYASNSGHWQNSV